MNETLDDVDVLAWREAIDTVVRDTAANADELMDSVAFIGRLDHTIGMEGDDLTEAVREAVDEHLADTLPPVADRIAGRVLEAKGTTVEDGQACRVFRVRIIESGTSRNKRRYPTAVLHRARDLYEGAKAFDHHRTPEELRSSTIAGLVGHYRNVEAVTAGLDADLVLLPSATHTAEALDATIAAQERGLAPLVGISHDAMTQLKTVRVANGHVQEAVAITKVNSADVVADPSAGGKAIRVLAGGTDPADAGLSNEEDDVPVTSEAVLEALKTATPEQLAQFAAAAGLVRATEAAEEHEQEYDKGSYTAKMMIRDKVTEAELPPAVATQLIATLPQRITEADVDYYLGMLKQSLGVAERAELIPTATAVVTQESFDKKVKAMDGLLDPTGRTPGYRSLKAAWADITNARVRAWDSDINEQIMRDTCAVNYDSHGRVGEFARSTESLDTTSWAQVLGDSITRQAIALYGTPSLQSWRKVVSSMPSVNDFREQKRVRVGGYGLLPTVAQGGPYQPLTSPTDEEAVYSVMKRGGTEDLTWETIVNDDIGKVQQIPRNLGLAAAITIYRYVWDIFVDNAATSYDAVTLFHAATHGNLNTSAALSQTNLSAARATMRNQAAYGHSTNILSLVPKLLVVPNELEERAFQLANSAVAIPSTPAGPSDTPNLHRGLDVEVIDYWTDADNWFLFADPMLCPLVELGFLFGRQDPEIFTQQDQTVGSMFETDRLFYKIRHVYAGTPLDHRGMSRNEA